MKLWLLRPRNYDHPSWNYPKPWDGIYDCNYGFVIRAETEFEARRLAQEYGADEIGWRKKLNTWLDSSITSCEVLLHEGSPGCIIKDFHAG